MESVSTIRRGRPERSRKFLNPISITRHLWSYRYLIFQLARREVIGRYKGSFLGIGWSVIYPLMLLAVYTFVFSVVFRAKWGMTVEDGRTTFALTLFMGMITFNLFGETANASTGVILANTNYVKKVVFPLEILPLVTFLTVLVSNLFGLAVLLAGVLLVKHTLPWTILLLPAAWFPVMLFSLGCAYFLSSLGVFVRDIAAAISILTTMLFFLSPVFYPLSAVPAKFRVFIQLNPLAVYIHHAREVVLWGLLPDWRVYLLGLTLSIAVFCCGFIWFIRSKRAFADVI
jgi:lipopolysaccharide transport system permease protein